MYFYFLFIQKHTLSYLLSERLLHTTGPVSLKALTSIFPWITAVFCEENLYE